jgi:hypothetical protein
LGLFSKNAKTTQLNLLLRWSLGSLLGLSFCAEPGTIHGIPPKHDSKYLLRFPLDFLSYDYQQMDCDPKLPDLIRDGLPLHFRPNPIPDDSGLMDLPVTAGSGLAELVASEVAAASVIDVHTHLLPPSHGALCLWGIDELLTYVSTSRLVRFWRTII